ncbi:unnamed protein product, partial [Didymodactylos carnosus]
MGKFEQLPNELIYNIFDYLNGNEIYNSFYYLNKRFHLLIKNSSLHFKCSSLIRLDILFDYVIPYINTKHIKALTIKDGKPTYFPSPADLAKFLLSGLRTNRFFIINSRHWINLQTIKLNFRKPCCWKVQNLEIVVENLDKFPNLIHLTLQTSYNFPSDNTIDLMCSKIFPLTNLKYLSFCRENYIIPKFDKLQLQPYQQSSSIEYLTMPNSDFQFSELEALFAYMPKLKYLNLTLIKPYKHFYSMFNWAIDTNSQQHSFTAPQDLKEIKLDFYEENISSKEIISLLTQITKLEKLTVNIRYVLVIDEILILMLFHTSLPLLKSCRISFTNVSRLELNCRTQRWLSIY